MARAEAVAKVSWRTTRSASTYPMWLLILKVALRSGCLFGAMLKPAEPSIAYIRSVSLLNSRSQSPMLGGKRSPHNHRHLLKPIGRSRLPEEQVPADARHRDCSQRMKTKLLTEDENKAGPFLNSIPHLKLVANAC
jgi:hypothetical protein